MKLAATYRAAEDPVKIFKLMWYDWCQELEAPEQLAKPTDVYINIMIAKTREYNRLWNTISDEIQGVKPDGFLNEVKRRMIETAGVDEKALAAAKYL